MVALLLVTLALALRDRRPRGAGGRGRGGRGAAVVALGFAAVKVAAASRSTGSRVTGPSAWRTRPGDRGAADPRRGHRRSAAGQPEARQQRPSHGQLRVPHHAAHGGRRAGAWGSCSTRGCWSAASVVIPSVYRSHEALGLALGASFLALFVHALFYSGFLEDPITWLVLAVAAGWSMRPVSRRRDADPPARVEAHGVSRIATSGSGAGGAGLLAVLLAIVAVTLPELGSDPWRSVRSVDPRVRWLRSCAPPGRSGTWASRGPRLHGRAAVRRGLADAAAATAPGRAGPAWRRARGGRAALGTVRRAPARDCATPPRPGSSPTTRPTRSRSGGDLLLDGENPYGHDYRESGLERFYTRDGTVSERVREREVALRHFAYFPGALLSAAAWRVLPEPLRRLPPARPACHAAHPRRGARSSARRSPGGW